MTLSKNQIVSRLLKQLLLIPVLILAAGCPVAMQRVPGDTELLSEPVTGYGYYLYIPSWHRSDRTWPLVVTCHGTKPYDSAWQQIHEWRGLAERLGLIVVAPKLKAVSSVGLVSTGRQLSAQQQDEQAILNIVRRTISAFNINPNWVFLTGWSGGAYDVYYVGLRNPQVFRALASRMGSFEPKYLADVQERIDPYQPVFIFFASGDFAPIKKQCYQAFEWLKAQGLKRVKYREVTGKHQRRPQMAAEFFKDVVEKYTYVKLSAVKGVGGDPLLVQFYLTADPAPAAVVWEFGDGQVSNKLEPQHRYASGGQYQVNLTIINAQKTRTSRTLELQLSGH